VRSTLEVIRGWLLIVLVVGVVGTEAELLLLKHTDGWWQLAPVALIGVSFLALGWYAIARNAASIRALQIVMLLFLVSGGAGTIQHFLGNVAYERESNPSLSGVELYKGALMGTTPSLAPGTMIQLGLIGLLFTYRHPRLGASKRPGDSPSSSWGES
jgi:hypothetical protein